MWSILVDIQGNVSKILTENKALRREVEDLKSSLESSDVQIANLKQLIEGSSATFRAHEKHLKDHREYIELLEDKLYDLELQQDSLEQYTRKYNIEIHGVPESKDENLHELITSVASKLDVDIQRQDIDIIHRLHRKPPRIKPIIVRFTTHGKKQELYQARYKLRDIDLSIILKVPGLEGKSHNLYINENLTSKRKELLGKARKLKNEKKVSPCMDNGRENISESIRRSQSHQDQR